MRRIVVLLAVVVTVFTGTWFYSLKGQSGRVSHKGDLGQICSMLPSTTQFLWAVDLRDKVDLRQELPVWHKSLSGVALRVFEQAEQELDIPAEELVQLADPAGFVGLLPASGRTSLWQGQPQTLWGLALADPRRVEEHLRRVLEKGQPKPELIEVGGSSFWVVDSLYLGIHQGYLLGADSRPGLEALLASLEGKASNLSSQAEFVEMRQQLPQQQGTLAFLKLQGLKFPFPGFKEELPAFDSLALGMDGSDKKFRADLILALKSSSSTSQRLLTPPQEPLALAQMIPARWNNYGAIDLHYGYRAVAELVRLDPSSRQRLEQGLAQAQLLTGLDLEKDIFAALTGEVAWSGNFWDNLPQLLIPYFEKRTNQNQLKSCSTNQKNIAVGLEMYACDYSGHYPSSLAQLNPLYLYKIPRCPKARRDSYSQSYEVVSGPDHFSFCCQGNSHGQQDYPHYSSLVGLDEGKTLQIAEAVPSPQPTVVLALKVRDLKKAEALLQRLDRLAPWKPAGALGSVKLERFSGSQPIVRALVSRPVPALLLAAGPEGQTLLQECLETKDPVSRIPEMQQASQDYSSHWISLGFLDFKPLLEQDRVKLQPRPDSAEKTQDCRVVSYALVEGKHLRLTTQGSTPLLESGAVLASVALPDFLKARSQRQLIACKSNEKNIATALEMYATDFSGRYPKDFQPLLQGQYLRLIPTCPAAGKDTYSHSYQVESQADLYSFCCQGLNHKGLVPADYPRYDAAMGLIDSP